MEKIKNKTPRFKSASILNDEFRSLVDSKLGELDTANSFMYLYRRFGEPFMNNNDDNKILYEYRFKHEDLVLIIHASYHKYVYFSLSIPKSRLNKWQKDKTVFLKELYRKYKNNVFMPFGSLFYGIPLTILTKNQFQKNWNLFFKEVENSLSKEDCEYIYTQFQSENPNRQSFKMLEPIEKQLYKNFISNLTESERLELNKNIPLLEDIENLKEQCEFLINEFLKGVYIRDVPINIKGYESETNKIEYYEDDDSTDDE